MLLPERRIPLTVARLPPGTLRRARLTHTRMGARHQLGMLLHERLIRIKTAAKPPHGMRRQELPTRIRTASPRTGTTTMEAERLVRAGAEDGVVLRTTRGATRQATRHLHGQPTQVTLHG